MAHTAYMVESGIHIPKYNTGAKESIYPWDDMDVGDSFFVPGGTLKKLASRVAYASKTKNKKFIARTMDDGVRVWRTE